MPNEMIPEVAVAGQRAVSLQWKLNIVLILGMKLPYLESIQPKPTPAIRYIWLRMKWPESFESTKPSRNSVTCRWNGKQCMTRRYSATSNMAVPTGSTKNNSSGLDFDQLDCVDLYLGNLHRCWLQVESYMSQEYEILCVSNWAPFYEVPPYPAATAVLRKGRKRLL